LGALADGGQLVDFRFPYSHIWIVSLLALVYFSILASRFMSFIQGHTMVEMAHFSRSNRMAPWVTIVPGAFRARHFCSISSFYSRLSYFWVLLPYFSLTGVSRRGGQQVTATQTVLVGIVGHFSADSMMETQDIVGLEGTKLCFYDTLIITSLLDTSVRTKSHCNCR
jgi:hypothetical protein